MRNLLSFYLPSIDPSFFNMKIYILLQGCAKKIYCTTIIMAKDKNFQVLAKMWGKFS